MLTMSNERRPNGKGHIEKKTLSGLVLQKKSLLWVVIVFFQANLWK